MPKRFSLYALLATVTLIGLLFYRVIEPFLFSLLFATVLAVLFRPIFTWACKKMGGRERTAAMLTTVGILLLFLLPLGAALVLAGIQMVDVSAEVVQLVKGEPSELEDEWKQIKESPLVTKAVERYEQLSETQQKRLQTLVAEGTDGFVKQVYQKTFGLVGNIIGAMIGMVVTALTLYYLFVDGERILEEVKSLTPLDDAEEDALVDQFGKVCRGVVTGTVVAALVQALLAGIGFFFVGVPNLPLLMTLTMICAFIPFFGAGAVVMVVVAWLAFEGHYTAATLLFLYSMAVVSTSDNLIRAYIIGNEVKLNPLVAFITVIGAIQLIGLWGIFVGPMVAAFFYTLLKLLRDRMMEEGRSLGTSKATT